MLLITGARPGTCTPRTNGSGNTAVSAPGRITTRKYQVTETTIRMPSATRHVDKVYDTPAMCDLAQVAGEEPLYRAIFERGPVAVGINANKLQAYGSGVVMLDDCQPLGRGIESINHAALVVGWGTTDDGVKYWEIKNSYGPQWGDEGFFRLERGRVGEHKFGTCGLLFESVYPVVTKAGDATSTDAPCVEGISPKANVL